MWHEQEATSCVRPCHRECRIALDMSRQRKKTLVWVPFLTGNNAYWALFCYMEEKSNQRQR